MYDQPCCGIILDGAYEHRGQTGHSRRVDFQHQTRGGFTLHTRSSISRAGATRLTNLFLKYAPSLEKLIAITIPSPSNGCLTRSFPTCGTMARQRGSRSVGRCSDTINLLTRQAFVLLHESLVSKGRDSFMASYSAGL